VVPGSPHKSKTIEQVAVENVATSLAIENARLKQELSAFDRDFFEELEDLKFKYTKLQVFSSIYISMIFEKLSGALTNFGESYCCCYHKR
jgi:hypothetical protein